ncbi:transmembrane protein 268 [Tiliqua scincoides]|uniref:transmembrane protein 268 n=1 Tax=Tiliqua scincoides TaxID=71010 RepID=UPI0034630944
MARVKSHVCASKSDVPPASVSYCQSLGDDRSVHWKKEVLNGQELVVLTVRDGCTLSSVDSNLCESLETWGIRMTPDQWKILIQCAVLGPEVRKYIFYNSRAFGILIAVVVYVTLWVNLFSTLETFSLAGYWECSILVTGVALSLALAIQLLIRWHQRKLNMNTDMRLAAANEAFMKNEFLVGITDVFEKHQSIPQLWLAHVDVSPCHRSLVDTLTELEKSQLAFLRQSLDKLYIVIEVPIVPNQDEEVAGNPLEESPLLRDPESSDRAPLARRKRLRLVPDRAPEVLAQELLVIFSSYYIRLLVSGQLPEVPARRHVAVGHSPCLCQFIETTVLQKKSLQLRR